MNQQFPSMENKNLILEELQEAAKVLESFLSNENSLKNIEAAAKKMADCIKDGGKIFSCGNGGSHCDAMHFAEELTGRYRETVRPCLPLPYLMPAISHVQPMILAMTLSFRASLRD